MSFIFFGGGGGGGGGGYINLLLSYSYYVLTEYKQLGQASALKVAYIFKVFGAQSWLMVAM